MKNLWLFFLVGLSTGFVNEKVSTCKLFCCFTCRPVGETVNFFFVIFLISGGGMDLWAVKRRLVQANLHNVWFCSVDHFQRNIFHKRKVKNKLLDKRSSPSPLIVITFLKIIFQQYSCIQANFWGPVGVRFASLFSLSSQLWHLNQSLHTWPTFIIHPSLKRVIFFSLSWIRKYWVFNQSLN